MQPVAALFVLKGGPYFGLEGVDPWDEQRDARRYAGPWPVVAHPPCSRWCQLAGLVQARYGYAKGDDGGAFEAALRAVREWGGVLEHPAYSAAWSAYGLPEPHRDGGWQHGLCGGASCYVEQWRYGHPARKATWLYAFGCELPALRWGYRQEAGDLAAVSWTWNRGLDPARRRVGKDQASRTPREFREVLLEMARSSRRAASA